MFSIIPKIPLYKSFRRFGHPKLFPLSLTLNATYRCPSRCETCNIWKKEADEFSLEEWKKTFRNIGKGKIYWLILSGGEPFLRKDLPELAKLACQYLNPKVINIPTNGYLHQIIPGAVEKIIENCPQSQIIINFSLDGIGEEHDKIRNLKGSFENLEKSYAAVRKIKNPRLTVGVHTVISKLNWKNISSIYDFVSEQMKPDSYITEIAEKRVELANEELDIFPSCEEYGEAIDFLIEKMKEQKLKGLSKITRALRLNYYNLAKKIIRQKTQVLPCYAGFASAQISADGEVWPCCVRADNLGNLRENDYNFKKIWLGKKADNVRKSIKSKDCHCPLASASYTNMLMDGKTLARVSRVFLKN